MLNAYQESLNKRLLGIPVTGPPSPWLHLTTISVGGFAAAGFSAREEYLLIVTQSGRGVFELPSGAKVGRDREGSWSWYDARNLSARGIAPIADEVVPVAGIHGGGMPTLTEDGWSLERVAPDWPNELVFLSPQGSSAIDDREGKRTYNLGPEPDGEQIVTFGFSRSGHYFIIGVSSSVELFGRENRAG